jgi:hypothetical protein
MEFTALITDIPGNVLVSASLPLFLLQLAEFFQERKSISDGHMLCNDGYVR